MAWTVSFLILSIVFLASCHSTAKTEAPRTNLERVAEEVRRSEETKKAVVAITDSLLEKGLEAKYCPMCGRHYSAQLTHCPADGAELKKVE